MISFTLRKGYNFFKTKYLFAIKLMFKVITMSIIFRNIYFSS